jgi:hypothetical protein
MIPLRRFALPRRTFLRGAIGGAGVALGLPLLEAMLDRHGEAHADGSSLPTRFVAFFFGNGVLLDRFEPTTTGPDWTPSPELMPIAPFAARTSVITGLQNHGKLPDGSFIGHFEGMTALTGASPVMNPMSYGYDPGGPSLDEVIADHIAATSPTTMRSMQVGIAKAPGLAGMGTLTSAMSYRGTPGNVVALPPVVDPRAVWTNLFGAFVAPPDDRPVKLSVIDAVDAGASRLRAKLGVRDTQRIDAHLQALAELEQKIAATPPACQLPTQPTEGNEELEGAEQHAMVSGLMAQLIAMAFTCDVTRVASCLFLNGAADTVFGEAGAGTGHHVLSHETSYEGASKEQFNANITFVIQQFADLLQALDNAPDPDGTTMLDSSIVLCTTDCSVGYHHSLRRQPLVVAGGGRGHLVQPGIHHSAIANTATDPNGFNDSGATLPTTGNVSDVLLSILQAFDPSATSVGDAEAGSSTPLGAILA